MTVRCNGSTNLGRLSKIQMKRFYNWRYKIAAEVVDCSIVGQCPNLFYWHRLKNHPIKNPLLYMFVHFHRLFIFLLSWGIVLTAPMQAWGNTPPPKSKQAAPIQSPQVSATASTKKLAATKKPMRPKRVIVRKPIIPAEEIQGVPIYSSALLVVDQSNNTVLMNKNAQQVMPLASLTKLMTAMVVLDSGLANDEVINIDDADVDWLKNSRSRLYVGLQLRRADALLLALMSSENRAAHALARFSPGGMPAFIMSMNQKAAILGMHQTHFDDPTGLSPTNVSSPRDIAILVHAANQYPTIRQYSTTSSAIMHVGERALKFSNTNPIIKNDSDLLDIQLSKTGHTNEAGFCLAFSALVGAKPITVVMMAAASKAKRFRDLVNIAEFVNARFIH